MKQQVTTETPILLSTNGNSSIDTVTIELLASWRQEDAHATPEQIKAAEEDLRQFIRAMNENRVSAGEAILYP